MSTNFSQTFRCVRSVCFPASLLTSYQLETCFSSCGEDPYHTVPLRAVCVECPGSILWECLICKTCLMKGIELCVECLAGRVELGQHRATHKYRLVDNGGLHLLGRWQTHLLYLVIMFLIFYFSAIGLARNWCSCLMELNSLVREICQVK